MELDFESKTAPFLVRDCAFSTIATGYMARTLREFCDLMKIISPESIYHHFWRQTIETSLPPGSYYNDFSHWAHYDLHDDFLAERLTWVNPTEYPDLEKLRDDVVKIVEKRIGEQDEQSASLNVLPFYFVKANIVVFNTAHTLDVPEGLVKVLPKLSTSSIFYHFIDARSRHLSNQDDFSVWLQGYGDKYATLIQKLREIDPYFISLQDLQKKITATATEFFI